MSGAAPRIGRVRLPQTTSRATTRIGGPLKKKPKEKPIDPKSSKAGIFLSTTQDSLRRYSPYMFYQGEDLDYVEVGPDGKKIEKVAAGKKKGGKKGGAKLPPIDGSTPLPNDADAAIADNVTEGAISRNKPTKSSDLVLNVNLQAITREESNKAFFKIDGNGSGKISSAELKDGVSSLWPELRNKELVVMRAYKSADIDKSAFVTKKEFYNFLLFIRAFDTAWDVFSQIDVNGDKRVSLDDFLLGAKPMRKYGIVMDDAEATFYSLERNGGKFVRFEEVCVIFAEEAMKNDLLSQPSPSSIAVNPKDPRQTMPGGGWNSPTFKTPTASLSQLDNYDDEFTGGAVLNMVRDLRSKRERLRSRKFNDVFEQAIPENLVPLQLRLQGEVKNVDGNTPLINRSDLITLCKDAYGIESDFLLELLCKELDQKGTGFIHYEKLLNLLTKYLGMSPHKEGTVASCFRVFDVDKRGSLNLRRIRSMKAAKKKDLYGTTGSNFAMIKSLLDLWNNSGDPTLTTTLTAKAFAQFMEVNGSLVHGFLEEIFRHILVKEFKYHREQLLVYPDPPTLYQCVNGEVPNYNKEMLSAIPELALFIPGKPFVPINTGAML